MASGTIRHPPSPTATLPSHPPFNHSCFISSFSFSSLSKQRTPLPPTFVSLSSPDPLLFHPIPPPPKSGSLTLGFLSCCQSIIFSPVSLPLSPISAVPSASPLSVTQGKGNSTCSKSRNRLSAKACLFTFYYLKSKGVDFSLK